MSGCEFLLIFPAYDLLSFLKPEINDFCSLFKYSFFILSLLSFWESSEIYFRSLYCIPCLILFKINFSSIKSLHAPFLGSFFCPIFQFSNSIIGCISVQFSSVQSLSRVRLFVTPWTAACQASLSFTISWSFFYSIFNGYIMLHCIYYKIYI